jgi:uncharacterized protein (DUF2147 family)
MRGLKMTLTKIAAATLALALSIAPAFAGNLPSPAGTWQITSGESRYEVEMCGDGTALCATLVWLRDDVRTPENLAYLNKMVVVEAEQARPLKWEGRVTYEGKSYNGNITMLDGNTLRMAGCKAVACESMIFNRV